VLINGRKALLSWHFRPNLGGALPNLSVTNCQAIVAHPAHPRAERAARVRAAVSAPEPCTAHASLFRPRLRSRLTPSPLFLPRPSPHAGEESRRAWKFLRGAASRARGGEYPLPVPLRSPLRARARPSRSRSSGCSQTPCSELWIR